MNDEIQKRLKLKEQMVASEAATVAINKKVAELVKQKIQEEIQREKTSGSALGMKLDSSNQGTKMADEDHRG